jgi:ABC-type maltose transport system permease subunit
MYGMILLSSWCFPCISTPDSFRLIFFAAAPILAVYPFMQRYFVVGLNVGGVKE